MPTVPLTVISFDAKRSRAEVRYSVPFVDERRRSARRTVRGQWPRQINAGCWWLPQEFGMREGHTETYVALELYIDNWRWAGVPFSCVRKR